MSRVDHIVARRSGGTRKVHVIWNNAGPGRRQASTSTRNGVTRGHVTTSFHKQGDHWWRGRFADLVERKNDDGTYAPRERPRRPHLATTNPDFRPEMVPRPRGMSRQVQRLLYRKACKAAGVPWTAVK